MKNYTDYCWDLRLDPNAKQSMKMYKCYKEVSRASTDIKKDEMKPNYPWPVATVNTNWMIVDECCSFAPNAPTQEKSVPCQKKEKTMYVDNDKHIESSKINYLSDRLDGIYYTIDGRLKKQFGMVNDPAPETAEDFIKRVQDGKFVLNDETKKKNVYDPSRYIVWRDPSVKEDTEGFKAAKKQYDEAARKVRDTIAIGTPAEALEAIYKLEAWTPTVGNA